MDLGLAQNIAMQAVQVIHFQQFVHELRPRMANVAGCFSNCESETLKQNGWGDSGNFANVTTRKDEKVMNRRPKGIEPFVQRDLHLGHDTTPSVKALCAHQ